jgi:hypothetical protein
MGRGKFTTSDFYCTKCGRQGIPIARKVGAEREAGHLKKLFCLYCKQEVNMVECKPYTKYTHDDFLVEFENNNFDETGIRKMTYGELKEALRQKVNYAEN